jgi:sugar lactone lactonase YvrE
MASLVKTIAALAVAALCSSATAQTLYAVSVRTYSDPSYEGVEGNLYRVDPATAVTTLVAPLRLRGGESVGLDGLAIHPKSREFLGITTRAATVIPHSLVRLDPQSGTVSVVGNLVISGSDISFDSEGTLFIWLPQTSQVGRIDLTTGTVTALGTPRPATASKGGFAVIQDGRALVAASGGKGTLDTIDIKTGAVTASVALTGARYPELIAGLAESQDGTLLAVNTNGGAPARADLVRIDRRSGRITTIGALPNDTDAITFGPAAQAESGWDLDRWRAVLLVVLALFAIGFLAFAAIKRGRA